MACLARELVTRGVPTTVVALHELLPWVRGTGARIVAVGGDAEGAGPEGDAAPGGQHWPRGQRPGGGGLSHTRMVTAWLRSLSSGFAEAELDVVADGDVVVGGVLALDDLCALRQAWGCRPVLTLLSPLHPTEDGAGCLLPLRPRGRTRANLWGGRLAVMSAAAMCTTTGRTVRARLGLPATSARGFLRELHTVPTLHATSPAIVPLPTGLPAPVWQTGFWTGAPGDGGPGDGGPVADVPDGLAGFLDAGEPPVLLGFGSMPSADPEADVTLLAAAARAARRRAVIRRPVGPTPGSCAPYGHLDGTDDVFVIREAPYAWLMPRVAAVVHHGGAGTLTQAVSAGVPSVAVPFGVDQPYYGRRLHELGLGPAPLPRRRLTAERLAARIRAMTSGPEASAHRAAALRIGGLLRQDPGVTVAADRITELCAGGRRSP